jgi:lantibiotic transport system permease protein
MSTIVGAFLAERIKSKRTLAVYLSVLGPVLAVAMSLFSLALVDGMAKAKGIEPWQAYLPSSLTLWFSFVLPLVVTLQAAQTAQLEHGNHKWKHLLSLPVPRSSLFLGKWLWLLALSVASNILVAGSLLIVCAINGLTSFSDGSFSLALSYVISQAVIAFTCSLLLVAIQFVVSVRLASFAAAVSIGFVGTIFGMFAKGLADSVMSFFPWAMPGIAMRGDSAQTATMLAVSIVGAICILAAGTSEFGRRQIHS